ncbi:MAG: AAA family ATPase [Selenomonadaceae bacterium]|nr:AAA family ATPase [Selenomonadaceae bacterium]
MNDQEKKYFDALTDDRKKIANVLQEACVKGIERSIVDKYSDQAHFIYELLQNADDAKATDVEFSLEKERLIFRHDGKRHFSISDPKKENEDTENNTLGDINAITSIGNSTKANDDINSIGKFGVGFKAVFQYTSTPHVYDPNFKFHIENLIVPVELNDDFPTRRDCNTLFVFPFDSPRVTPDKAYDYISDKFKNLSYPLLFLKNIKSVNFNFGNVHGYYSKQIKETKILGDTTAEYIVLTQNNGGNQNKIEYLWLFSRTCTENNLRYSVGFFMNKDSQLIPVTKPAFCYFPTKEFTGLNFIVHAPFLLTDSRESIRAGEEHNEDMINKLAELSADAMEYLRDIGKEKSIRLITDDIIKIIPFDSNKFSDPLDNSRISFMPFFEKIKNKFKTSVLLPTVDGYIDSDNAYWASTLKIAELFNNEQLRDIVDNPKACWVFTSLAREKTSEKPKSYIDSIIRPYIYGISEENIINGRSGVRHYLENIKGISAEFIEKQTIDWLHKFYAWISENKDRKKMIINKPIFIDEDGKAAAAFDSKNQSILFLPDFEKIEGYTFISRKLLENTETKNFIEELGIKKPSRKDYIYNTILSQYEQDEVNVNRDEHFKIFFDYYCETPHDEADKLINLIKDCKFLIYCYSDNNKVDYDVGRNMYLPTSELRKYFETKANTQFVYLSYYENLVCKENKNQLTNFLTALGVKKEPAIEKVTIDVPKLIDGNPPQRAKYEIECYEKILDGCKEITEETVLKKDEDKSVILWYWLLKVIEKNRNLNASLYGTRKYHYRADKMEGFKSSTELLLKDKAWLINSDGKFVKAADVTVETLSDKYDKSNSEAFGILINFLEIKTEDEKNNSVNLTEDQRKKIALANKLKEYGIENEDDLEEFRKFKEAKQRAAENVNNETNVCTDNNKTINNDGRNDIDDIFAGETEKPSDGSDNQSISKLNVVKDIVKRTRNANKSDTLNEVDENKITAEDEHDEDEYTPQSIDYTKKIERAKEKSAEEIEKIIRLEELQTLATESPKYSYGWFKALLEMEELNSQESNFGNREISISFGKVEREPNTKRTLVLKYPSRYIPQFMEDLADIPLVLHMGNHTKTVPIEVANIVSYTLRVKMKNAEDLANIDLTTVTSATIDAKSPVFLLEELINQFHSLADEKDWADDFDLRENLCKDIEFVFGPPGTGKTTHLAKNVLIPMMKNQNCKVLVLTPTNKAADVLVRRIMELSADKTYEEWLIRFGATGDETIEQSPVFKDKTFDIRTLKKNVTVATIVRFPYDFFMPDNKRIFLREINWDYIVIDEASMIPLANIIFPLYKKTPNKFIIAGDPFQIEPITSVNFWKDENIYTLVNLNSFTNPETVPHKYKVTCLTTQYRSIPDIGEVFGNFAYDGILKHYRTANTQRRINFGKDLEIKALNIIKFPVSKYESIYRCKRLQHSSSYQIYSALFTFEYVCYLSGVIAKNNRGQLFKIGIIAPYKAQADMIDKLISSEKLPQEINVQVGTIHGFQGDECDIIFSVFNTPPTISNSKEMFLNKKNIINVSVSRARDYLFIVMPDDDTENISNLTLVKKIEHLIKARDYKEILSSELEELMFGDSEYLEKNTFSTSHQNVNVYGLPEKYYEVRTEDTAVDVQIHKPTKENIITENLSIDMQSNDEDYVDSYDLDENLIPEELRDDAIDIPVSGDMTGWFYLVPYEDKLISHAHKGTARMYTPLVKNGKTKNVTVSVVKEDRIIYIAKYLFDLYEQELSEPEGIKIKIANV